MGSASCRDARGASRSDMGPWSRSGGRAIFLEEHRCIVPNVHAGHQLPKSVGKSASRRARHTPKSLDELRLGDLGGAAQHSPTGGREPDLNSTAILLRLVTKHQSAVDEAAHDHRHRTLVSGGAKRKLGQRGGGLLGQFLKHEDLRSAEASISFGGPRRDAEGANDPTQMVHHGKRFGVKCMGDHGLSTVIAPAERRRNTGATPSSSPASPRAASSSRPSGPPPPPTTIS
jgi:hypothetical protein